jgi:peptide/nickel transport system permease protein
VQFGLYLKQVATGDFGTSLYTHRPVKLDLGLRLPATIELAMATMLLAIVLGVPVGMVAAVNRNGWIDQALRVFTIAGLAVASFWIAIIFQLVFSLHLEWLPLRGRMADAVSPPASITGLYVVDYLLGGRFHDAFIALKHLVLPALTLALPALATIARFTRSSAIETLQRDFVMWERAVGYPRRVLIWKYVLRSSLSATVTQIGLLFGLFLSGSVVVEAVYGWPGLGDYLYNAVILSDYQPVMATTLLVGAIYAAVNILVDVVQGWLDPRLGHA